MRAFLKTLDEHVWYAIERRSTKLETTIKTWMRDEITNYNWNNSRGLNTIFIVVSLEKI